MNSDEAFKINDSVIAKVEHIKYLGSVIDKKLNLSEHIDYTCKKMGKRIRKRISKSIAVTIYNTINKPHFENGSTILYTCSTVVQLSRM